MKTFNVGTRVSINAIDNGVRDLTEYAGMTGVVKDVLDTDGFERSICRLAIGFDFPEEHLPEFRIEYDRAHDGMNTGLFSSTELTVIETD